MVLIDGHEYVYDGTVNQEGEAFGLGIATNVKYPDWTYTGTFYKNTLHGKSKNCRSFIWY